MAFQDRPLNGLEQGGSFLSGAAAMFFPSMMITVIICIAGPSNLWVNILLLPIITSSIVGGVHAIQFFTERKSKIHWYEENQKTISKLNRIQQDNFRLEKKIQLLQEEVDGKRAHGIKLDK